MRGSSPTLIKDVLILPSIPEQFLPYTHSTHFRKKKMAILLNKTQRLMNHPYTWRIVGLASATIGLLCLALSSSFNSLFKQWNLLKTFLHCVFSFIICMAVLFSKVWHHSITSLRLKAHMAILVLTITPFCIFLTMKPDTYIVVSCAGFAVMWLSLSSQTRCRFEVGFFYFFLGILLVQLIKMNWFLGIVGAGFSYSLILLSSCLDALPQENGYVGVGLQDHPQVEIQVDSLKSQSQSNTKDYAIIQENTEINVFKPRLLDAIKALREKNLLLIRLLNWNLGKCFQPDHNLFIDNLPLEIINNLNEAMKLTVDAGFEEECFQLYTSCRKEFLQQCLSELNLKILIECEYESAGTTTERIQNWIRASEIAFQILFTNERRLCDRVFFGISSIGDLSFVQICKEPAICLLKFPRTFVVETNWPMIFKEVLEVLKTLLEIIPDLESLFPDQEAMSLKNEAIATRNRLGEAIRDIFKNMENLIHCDTRIPDVPGGIYPIAHDVVNCLHRVTKVRTTIERVWEEHPIVPKKEGTTPSFFLQMTEIMELLDTHLEARSKNYTEPALCYVSMINNAMFTQQKTEKLSNLAINDYHSRESYRLYSNSNYLHFRKHTSKVQKYLEGYQRSSWNEVLGLLKLDKEEEEESASSGLAAESMKEKLQLFNIQFDQICSIQSKWFAFDSVRREIIKTLENMLVPAYGYFIGRFHDFLGKHADEYIQFGIFDIKARLDDMFLGGKGEINSQK